MDKNSFTAKSMPQGGAQPAATRQAPSFIAEQGQLAAANTTRSAAAVPAKAAPVLLAGGKPLVIKTPPPPLIVVAQAHDFIRLQEEREKQAEQGGKIDIKGPQMEDLEAALVCLVKFVTKMKYSAKYTDEQYEYRHVTVPRKEMCAMIRDYSTRVACAKLLREVWDGKLMTEADWRAIGVQQSVGWENYAHHRPEPNVLLFRRKIPLPPTATTALSSKIEQIALE